MRGRAGDAWAGGGWMGETGVVVVDVGGLGWASGWSTVLDERVVDRAGRAGGRPCWSTVPQSTASAAVLDRCYVDSAAVDSI